MKDIIDAVSSSRRLKIFTAYYAFIYIAICLSLNLIHEYIPFFSSTVGTLVYKLVDVLIKAPFLYGLIRGIVTKNYHFAEGVASFAEKQNYGAYATYVCVGMAYEVIALFLSKINFAAISVVVVIMQLLVNYYLVIMYFVAIKDGGRVSLVKSLDVCIDRFRGKWLNVVSAELFMFAASFLSLLISSMAAEFLPAHESVSLILACINELQYGFLVVTWPIYYLYYYKLVFEEE